METEYTSPAAGVVFEGGSLRRRVYTYDMRTVVQNETDMRFSFIITLPDGATYDPVNSYFLWGKPGEELNRKVIAAITYEEDGQLKCGLVIPKFPAGAFSDRVRTKYHLAYTLNGVSCELETDPVTRSIYSICDGLIEKLDEDNTWYEYAEYLKGIRGTYHLPD